MGGDSANYLDLIKRAVEICMPNLRHYYRIVRKARVVGSYPTTGTGGKYFADVQPLRNDETDDEKEPVVPRVEIPILWGGPKRGVVCPPAVDGSPNVFVHGEKALRIGDPGTHSACCGPNTWKAAEGSGTVFVNGIPFTRLGDATEHCGGPGKMVNGSENVLAG